MQPAVIHSQDLFLWAALYKRICSCTPTNIQASVCPGASPRAAEARRLLSCFVGCHQGSAGHLQVSTSPKSSGNFGGELGFKVNATSIPAGVHPLHEPVLILSWASHLHGYGATTLSKERKIQGPCPKVYRKNSTAWCFPSPIRSIPCIFLLKASIFFPSAHLNYI